MPLTLATPREQITTLLTHADSEASNGWLGEALNKVGLAHARAVTLYGYAGEVTMAIETYRDALRRDHWDTSTTIYDPAALHAVYLAARGALAVVGEG